MNTKTSNSKILILNSGGGSELINGLSRGLTGLGHDVSTHTDDSTMSVEIPGESSVPDMVIWVQQLPQTPTPIMELNEEDWNSACEAEIKSAIDVSCQYYEACQSYVPTPNKAADERNPARLVFIIPTIAMAGAEGFSASAGAGEAVRIWAKSLAKAWGISEGTSENNPDTGDNKTKTRIDIRDMRVHTLALNPAHFLPAETAKNISSAMSLSDPALKDIGSPETDLAGILDLLLLEGANFWTGGTITADGGIWSGG